MNMTNKPNQFPLPFDFQTLRNVKGKKLPRQVKLDMIREGLRNDYSLNRISVEIGYSPSYLHNVYSQQPGHDLHDDLVKIVEAVKTEKQAQNNLESAKVVMKNQAKRIKELEAKLKEYEEVLTQLTNLIDK
jgi:transposase-like protein